MRLYISDDEIKEAKVPDDMLLIVTEKNGDERELTFSALVHEKADEFNSTDFMFLRASLAHNGSYHAGSHYGWYARVKADDLQPGN